MSSVTSSGLLFGISVSFRVIILDFVYLYMFRLVNCRYLTPINRMSQRAQMHKILHRFGFHCLYAWGAPLAIVTISQVLNNIDDISDSFKVGMRASGRVCWLQHKKAPIYTYLYGPIAAILVSNLIFFIMTAIEIHKVRIISSTTCAAQRNRQK